MTPDLRWRVMILQAVLVVVLGFGSAFLYWEASFTHGYVHDQLTAQKIAFPPAGSAAITSLPSSDAAAMARYAGQPVDDGDKAQTYANHFIAVHLREIGGGQTYSQISAAAQASPTNQKLAGLTQTLFRGETLRGLLLNVWGWWTIGTYALYAAVGLTIATIVVALALLFEAVVAPQRAARPARPVPTLRGVPAAR